MAFWSISVNLSLRQICSRNGASCMKAVQGAVQQLTRAQPRT